jgi:hypothetical protein
MQCICHTEAEILEKKQTIKMTHHHILFSKFVVITSSLVFSAILNTRHW